MHGFIADVKRIIRTFGFMQKAKKMYLIGWLFACTEYLLLFSTSYLYQFIIEVVSNPEEAEAIFRQILIFIALAFLVIPIAVIGRLKQANATEICTANLSKEVMRHISRLPVSTVQKYGNDFFTTRINGDVADACKIFSSHTIVALTKFSVVTIVSIILLVLNSWKMALFGIAISGICFVLALWLNPKVRNLEMDAKNANVDSMTYILELFQGLPVVRIFQLGKILQKKYQRACEIVYTKRVRYCTIRAVIFGTIDIFSFCAQPAALLIGLYLYATDGIDVASGVFMASIIAQMASAMLDFSSFVQTVQGGLVAQQRVFSVLDMPAEADRPDAASPDLSSDTAIEISNLTFGYTPEQLVFRNVNLKVEKDAKIAIVGNSGSGKSTLVKIVQGFYTPSAGEIKLFGAPISQMSLEHIRSLIAYIPQECILFEGTIAENISFGMDVTQEEIREAARRACIDSFIESLPDGYETFVTENGATFSGGQRQRIVLARAYLKKATILIMDEPTSALDAENEERVIQDIVNNTPGQTVLIISHRETQIKSLKKIAVGACAS